MRVKPSRIRLVPYKKRYDKDDLSPFWEVTMRRRPSKNQEEDPHQELDWTAS